LTLVAGGTLTEILTDSASVLVPATRSEVETALMSLKSAALLSGFRGAPPANITAILNAVEAIQNYVLANADSLEEVEVNPLICTPTDAIAADALMRTSQ
jgi:succinyl-CoA synthetase beta subunit